MLLKSRGPICPKTVIQGDLDTHGDEGWPAFLFQFLSHTHETLEKYVFYIDLEMILVPFFDIPNQKPVI